MSDQNPNEDKVELGADELALMQQLYRSAIPEPSLEERRAAFRRHVGITDTSHRGTDDAPEAAGADEAEVISIQEFAEQRRRRSRGSLVAAGAAAAIVAFIVGFTVTRPTAQSVETADPDAGEDSNVETASGDLVVRISMSASEVRTGDLVTFEALADDGNPSSYDWSFSPDDGTQWENGQARFTRSFSSSGTYTVALTACDGDTCTQGAKRITVEPSIDPDAGEITISDVSIEPRRFEERDDYWFADVAFTTSECTTAQYEYSTIGHAATHSTNTCVFDHEVTLGRDNFDRLLGGATYALTINVAASDGRTTQGTFSFQTQGAQLKHSGFSITNRTNTQVWMTISTGSCTSSEWVVRTVDGDVVNRLSRPSYPNADPSTGGECFVEHDMRAGDATFGAEQPLSPGTDYVVTITSVDQYGGSISSDYQISTNGATTGVSNIRWVQGDRSVQPCWIRPFPIYQAVWDGDQNADVVWFTGEVGFHGSMGPGEGSAPLSFDFEDRQLAGEKTIYVEVDGVRSPDHVITVTGSGCDDSDNDDLRDVQDNCPAVSNPDQADNDGDGIGNACDPTPAPVLDSDIDGVPDSRDNCIDDANATQTDNDGDGVGNVCDPTPDGEG